MDGYRELLDLLAVDEAVAADRFLVLRSKVVSYFEGRRISPAEDYADEVLRRVAAKLAAGEKILDINRYAFGIARFVRLESYREPVLVEIDDDHAGGEKRRVRVPPALTTNPNVDHEDDGSGGILRQCVGECLGKLSAHHRGLILAYYEADEASGKHIDRRRELARQYNKSAGALHKQIFLLRQKVAGCARDCARRELGKEW
jgi:DNA-directed RNA polymerase specialized sigma24 family protein